MKFLVLVIVSVLFIFWVGSIPKPFCKENQNPQIRLNLKEAIALKESNISFIYVNGTSMLPAIKDNSTCVCIKKKKYTIGDVVAFPFIIDNQAVNILHRINNTGEGIIFTKGDNNVRIDLPVSEEEIFCYVPEIPRWLKPFF